jgi:hypothetical protein
MLNDYSVYLTDKEFLQKWAEKLIGKGATLEKYFDEDDFDEFGGMEEFRVTEEYYITFNDGSEISVDWSVPDANFLSADSRDAEKGTMAHKYIREYEMDGWDIDIDSLVKEVSGVKKEKGGEASSLKVENEKDLEEVAKYMTKAVKKHSWDLKDLIHYFETDNNFDYKVRVKIADHTAIYEMPKTYENILKLLKEIVEGNGKKLSSDDSMAKGGEATEKEINDRVDALMKKLKEDGRVKRFVVSESGQKVFETIKLNKEKGAEGLYSRYHSADQHSLGIQQNWGLDEKEVYNHYKKSLQKKSSGDSMEKGGLTPAKARIMLHEGEAHGKPITDKQRRYFGAVASGYSKKENGGEAGDMNYEKDILPVLEEAVKTGWKPIAKKYRLYEETASEIENKSGDGFIAFTDGGYTIHAFNSLTDYDATGVTFPEKSQKQIDKWIQECYDEASEKHDEESEEHSEAYSECLGGIAVDFDLRAVYYKPDNGRSEFKGKHAVYVFGIINEDLKDRKDIIKEGFSFDNISELKEKLPVAINKVLAWYKADGIKLEKGGKVSSQSSWSKFWNSFANDGALITSGGYFDGGSKMEKGGKASKDGDRHAYYIKAWKKTIGNIKGKKPDYEDKTSLNWDEAQKEQSKLEKKYDSVGIYRKKDNDEVSITLGKLGKGGEVSEIKGYRLEDTDAIRDFEFDEYFTIVPPDADKVKIGIYALDLRDGSDFLIDESNNIDELIGSGDFAFGIEKSEKGGSVHAQKYSQKRVHMTKRGKSIDSKVKAMKAGWRKSKETGNFYFESRSNRSDKKPSQKI